MADHSHAVRVVENDSVSALLLAVMLCIARSEVGPRLNSQQDALRSIPSAPSPRRNLNVNVPRALVHELRYLKVSVSSGSNVAVA